MLALPISLDDATNMAEVTAYQERQSKRQRIEGAMPAADGPQDEKASRVRVLLALRFRVDVAPGSLRGGEGCCASL